MLSDLVLGLILKTTRDDRPRATTIADFCDRYSISKVTFWRRAKKGLTPPVRRIGKSCFILVDEEAAWLERVKNNELANG